MSSLVTEVLLQAGKLDKDDLQTKVSKMSSRSNEFKAEIEGIIEKKYGKFNPVFSSCKNLLCDITENQKQAKEIQGALSGVVKTQLQDSTSEFKKLTEEHSRTSELLFAVGRICQIAELFDNATNSGGSTKTKKESVRAILEIQSMLEDIKGTHLSELEIFKVLKDQFVLILDDMKCSLGEKWLNNIHWVLPAKGSNPSEVVLKIPRFEKENSSTTERVEFQDFVYAMSMLGLLKPKMHRFSEMVMKHIFLPLIGNQSLSPDFDCGKNNDQSLMTVSLRKESASTAVLGASTPSSLFRNVFGVLRCLHYNLLTFEVTENDESLNNNLMFIFSEHIRDDLLQLLIDRSLAMAIPRNREDLQNYKVVEEVVKKFETDAVDINFIPASVDGEPGSKLVAYVTNVSFHFANQRCTDILQQARVLMKKGIQKTQSISHKNMGGFERIGLLKKTAKASTDIVKMPIGTDFDSQKPSKLLSDDILHFPECCVSVCAIELMNLAYSTMNEAMTSDPGCAIRLVTTSQHIFELYHTVFPIYHKESLESIPQFSAVFLNDCMYLAHNLLTFGHQFSTISPHASKSLRLLTFIDKVPLLRQLGAECFLKQMRKQKSIMIQCLEPLRTFSSIQSEDKYNVMEKAMKQILYQLNHLKKVWSEVLQPHILRRSLCTLVNSCVAETVSIICTLEDISSDDSNSLKLVCIFMSDNIPILFRKETVGDNMDVADLSWQKQVSKWPRLQELILMLSGSLREIVDRWSEGKGPLASAFSVVEVKVLIRALFQNTEHRAEAISRIRL